MQSNPKLQKTEKAAVNIGVVELAQIDVLVENLLYTNRSDFIRTAIRKQLEYHQAYIDGLFAHGGIAGEETKVATIGGVGVIRISANDLLRLKAQEKKANVIVVGVLVVDRTISVELFSTMVVSVKVYGKIQAPKHLSQMIKGKGVDYEA